MATPKINENCHYVQNDPHKCKIKLERFHFDVLWRFGVIKESLSGGGAESDFTTWTTTVTSNNNTFQLYSIKGAIELKLYFVKAFM